MKKILLLVSVFLFCSVAEAQQVEVTTARKVAENWSHNVVGVKNNVDLQLVMTDEDEIHSTVYYYIFNDYNNNGFVIVAGDERIEPILGYSDESVFVTDNIPENITSFFEDYKEEMNVIFESGRKIRKHPNWKAIINGTYAAKSNSAVLPLVSTKWDQGCYYNAKCPVDYAGPCNHVYTGCVATAMAQVMKYWNYPEYGLGETVYINGNYGDLSIVHGDVHFDWNSMPNNVYSPNEAVATLMVNCGVSVRMGYSPSGSGASMGKVVSALRNHFGYDDAVVNNHKSDFNQYRWIEMLKEQLDASQPMEYSGRNSSEGHAFVCDGYDDNNMFHFNWGWSGYYDGYFAMNQLNPGNYTFNSDQTCIMNIIPDPTKICHIPHNINGSITRNTVNITWDEPDPDTVELVGYQIVCNDVVVDTVTENSYTGEYGYGNFRFCIQAMYDNGCLSDIIRCIDAFGSYPLPVDDFSAELHSENVILTWNVPHHTAYFDHFDIYKDNVLLASTTDTSYIDVVPDGTYHYCVIVNYEDELFSDSECVDVQVETQCLPPTNIEVTRVQGGYYIKWEPSADTYPIAYSFYKDGVMMADSLLSSHYYDNNVTGPVRFGVKSIYNFCESDIIDFMFDGIENVESYNFKVYPNPFATSVTVSRNASCNILVDVEYIVTNITGQIVYRTTTPNVFEWTPANDIVNGMYFISAYVDGVRVQTTKVVYQQ